MISSHPTIPLLVHEDCMEGLHLDLAKQQENLSKINANSAATNTKLDGLAEQQETAQGILNGIATDVDQINTNTSAIKTSSANASTLLNQIDADTSVIRTNSGNIKNNTDSLATSVGVPADAASANTVIGLLKSINLSLSNSRLIWFDAVTVQFAEMAPSNYTWGEAFTTIDLSSSTSEVITSDNLRCFIVVAAIGDAPGTTNQNRASLMMFPGDVYTFTWQSFKGQSGFYIKTMGYRVYWENNQWKGAATYTGIDFNASYNSNDIKIWNVSPQAGIFWIVGAFLKA